MNDRRFLQALNEAVLECDLPRSAAPGRAGEAELVAAWARLLRACVSRGVSVGDPRWRSLELRRVGGKPRFSLPRGGASGAADTGSPEGDFSVGLALLMGMLDHENDD